MPVEIRRNGYGWVSVEVSREILRLIFPNYPDTREIHELPEWAKHKLRS